MLAKSDNPSISKWRISGISTDFLVLAVLAACTFMLYWKTLSHSWGVDDQYYLWLLKEKGTPLREHLASLIQRFWGSEFRPVTFFTILIETLLFGRSPGIYHFFNLIYYSLLCFAIYKVSNRIFREYYQYAFWLAFLIALLFLFHPSHANIVSNIKNREVILSLGLGLLAINSSLSYSKTFRIKHFLLAYIFLMLALLSKRDAFVFLGLIPLANLIFVKKLALKKHLPAFLVFFALIAISMWLLHVRVADDVVIETETFQFDNPYVGQKLTLLENWSYKLRLAAVYEKFMVYPVGYYFYFGYDTVPMSTSFTPFVAGMGVLHLIIGALMFFFYRRKQHHLLFGPLFFFMGIAPFMGTGIAGYFAVRYSFIASLGFCMVLGQVIYFLTTRGPRVLKTGGLIILLGLMIIWGYYSFKRSLVWKDLYTLYDHDIPRISRSVNANRMGCQYYLDRAKESRDSLQRMTYLEKSQGYCDQAIRIAEVPFIMDLKAQGLILKNELDRAHDLYIRVLQLDSTYLEAYKFLAYDAWDLEEYSHSIHYLEKLLEYGPLDVDVVIDLTRLYIFTGQFNKAVDLNIELFEDGERYESLLNLGDIFIAQGDTASAIINYDRAINIKQEADILEELMRICRQARVDSMVFKLERMITKIGRSGPYNQ